MLQSDFSSTMISQLSVWCEICSRCVEKNLNSQYKHGLKFQMTGYFINSHSFPHQLLVKGCEILAEGHRQQVRLDSRKRKATPGDWKFHLGPVLIAQKESLEFRYVIFPKQIFFPSPLSFLPPLSPFLSPLSLKYKLVVMCFGIFRGRIKSFIIEEVTSDLAL